MENALHGSCACGRNKYVVEIPSTSTHTAQVLFDNSSLNRIHQAAPFTAWLRVPLSWYSSSAHSFFPDETAQSIRRTFVSPESRSHARRQFCGYCGTPLSTWEERTREEADYISITLGSLLEESVGRLEDMGLMGGEDDEEEENQGGAVLASAPTGERSSLFAPPQMPQNRGAPWFESLVEDGRLGRIKRNRGGYTSRDGSFRGEWEVVEWTGDSDDGGSSASNGKRKFGQGEGTADVAMRGA